jgi:hypothetical protein
MKSFTTNFVKGGIMDNPMGNTLDMWQQPSFQGAGWYKVIPYEREARGNLKCLGIQAPLCINDVGGITVIHIRENLPFQNIVELNINLRSIFGPATLVLGLDKDISFYKIERCSGEEIRDYQTFGNPVFTEVRGGHSDTNQGERYETEEPRRQIDTRSKPSIRRSSSKSDRKTKRT